MNTEDITIERYKDGAVISNHAAVFSYQVESINPRESVSNTFNSNHVIQNIEGLQIIPYGKGNNIPQLLRDTVYDSPNIPGVMEKKQGLLWGQGPLLYEEKFTEGKHGKRIRVRDWQDDEDITAWLESWGYIDYLLDVVTDFNFVQGSATRFVRQEGTKIGKPFFHSLVHLDMDDFRLAAPVGFSKETHAIVRDWQNHNFEYKTYPLINEADPFSLRNPVMYSRSKTFATKYYPIPTIYGSLEWIKRSTAVPLILKALAKNSINAKYHITSPASYWDGIRKQLEDKARLENRDYDEKELIAFEKELFRSITETLSDTENVGKIWHTKNMTALNGMSFAELGWKITPIDQNIKDFVETQIKIGNKADSSVSAALGIHKALAGISAEGKADSGSEQLYAYLMYKLIGVDIPEYIVMKAINFAIKHNFPHSKLRLGFYHEEAQKQEDQTSGDRVKNFA